MVRVVLKQRPAGSSDAGTHAVQILRADIKVNLLRVRRIAPARRPLIRPAITVEANPELRTPRHEERPPGVVPLPTQHLPVEAGQHHPAVLTSRHLGTSNVDSHPGIIRKKMHHLCLPIIRLTGPRALAAIEHRPATPGAQPEPVDLTELRD